MANYAKMISHLIQNSLWIMKPGHLTMFGKQMDYSSQKYTKRPKYTKALRACRNCKTILAKVSCSCCFSSKYVCLWYSSSLFIKSRDSLRQTRYSRSLVYVLFTSLVFRFLWPWHTQKLSNFCNITNEIKFPTRSISDSNNMLLNLKLWWRWFWGPQPGEMRRRAVW